MGIREREEEKGEERKRRRRKEEKRMKGKILNDENYS